MSTTYTINNRPTLLEYGDKVIFDLNGEVLTHRAFGSWLDNTEGPNDQVFNRLGLDKTVLAEAAYGYSREGFKDSGIWPESKHNDSAALARLVNAIYERIAMMFPEAKEKAPIPPKFTRGDHVRWNTPVFGHVRCGIVLSENPEKGDVTVDPDDNPGTPKTLDRARVSIVPPEPAVDTPCVTSARAQELAGEAAKPNWARFKKGDWVTGISTHKGSRQTGEIVRFDEAGIRFSHWEIKRADGITFWLKDNTLEAVAKPDEGENPPIGYVKFTKDFHGIRYGLEVGKVYPVTEDHVTVAPNGVRCGWSEEDSLRRGVAIRCDRDGNPIESANANWQRFKEGDCVTGISIHGSRQTGRILEFDAHGVHNAHWRIENPSGCNWLKDDTLEFAEHPKALAPEFRVASEDAGASNVTEFYLEQADKCVRILAKRAGRRQVIASIVPDAKTGKATLARPYMHFFDTLQVESDGNGRIKLRS